MDAEGGSSSIEDVGEGVGGVIAEDVEGRLDRCMSSVRRVAPALESLRLRITTYQCEFDSVDSRLTSVEEQWALIERHLCDLDNRLSAMDAAMDGSIEDLERLSELRYTRDVNVCAGEIWKRIAEPSSSTLGVDGNPLAIPENAEDNAEDIRKAAMILGLVNQVSEVEELSERCIQAALRTIVDEIESSLDPAVRQCLDGLSTFPHLELTLSDQFTTIRKYEAFKRAFPERFPEQETALEYQ